MDGGSQGAASAFWSTASQGEVVTFFRHLGEDVSMLGEADLTGNSAPFVLDCGRRLVFSRGC